MNQDDGPKRIIAYAQLHLQKGSLTKEAEVLTKDP
jgi:hypothetical protein